MTSLATPLALKHHTLKNRIIMGSMHTGLEEHPDGARRLAAFYQERAQAGAALIITGGISPNTAGRLTEHGAVLTSPEQLPFHRHITDAVHQAGGKICLQILHAGRYASHAAPKAPSAIKSPISRTAPAALTAAEIAQTIADYANCAQLAQQGGYDGVEIMGSEGYLINQFLAPATNHRQDAYGGSAENRRKFARDVVQAVRAACGEAFLIIYRFSLADLIEGGSTWAENAALAQELVSAGADLYNTGIGWHESRVPTIATAVPRAAFAGFTAKLKAASAIPVIAANRINMPAEAERIIKTGEADAVCLARPFLADAAWAAKALAGAPEAINTCIACNQACLDHIFAGKLTSCLVNPFACAETELTRTPAATPKNLAVIGAGPAGLAFAVTAAERGHRVTLFDQQAEIGGQLNIAKQIPGKPEFAETLRYYRHMLGVLGVTVRLNTEADAENLTGFDEIVLAAGIKPRRITIPGTENNPNVLSYLDVLRDKKPVGSSAAIIGAGGIGFDTAEYLSHTGPDSALHPVQFQQEWNIDPSLQEPGALLAPRPEFAPSPRRLWLLQRSEGTPGRQLGKTTGWIHQLTLKARGVTMLGGVTYRHFDEYGLHITRAGENMVLPVKQLIICAGQEADDSLTASLERLGKPVHLIGGCLDARELDAKRAIKAGTLLGLDI